MPNYQMPISYVVSATAITPARGLEPLKLSTILLLTDEVPANDLTGSYMIARTASAIAQQWGTETEVAQQAQAIFSQQPNILANDGYVIVAPFNNTPESGGDPAVQETFTAAITRLASEIYFEGILTTRAVTDEEAVAASNLVQSMNNRILMLPASSVNALTAETGLFTKIENNTKTIPVLYTLGENDDEAALNARLFAAAYLSRGLAVNYNGSNTTMTMNLKDLIGIPADTNISETILNQCVALGVDCFPSIEGLAKVISNRHGGMYFDQVANQIWFLNTIQRAVFNTLAQTQTKIPQTEAGLEKLTKAIRNVCNQGVTNGFIAPGTWNSTDTFGNYEDFYRNIEEFGYYIYHQPVVEQAQSEREQRQAPLYQIAAKEAGAIHSANIIITIEP